MLLNRERVWLVSAALLIALFIFSPEQGAESAKFTAANLLNVAPFLIMSIGIAAYAGATGADGLIARAFTGSPTVMILIAAAAGGLSPFCSCGVIPLIAALLAMGVPLSAVMAFWLASPVMDPSMFVLTTGVLGLEFAVAKTMAAVGLGVFGGMVVHVVSQAGGLTNPLREGIGNGGCGGSKVRTQNPVVWKFWQQQERVEKFAREGLNTTLFLAKWLTLAFLLESVMLVWLPAELVASALGGSGLAPIGIATLVGVPAYLNGYAALPLVGGLMEQGMASGAALSFLVAGGVSSLPAAIAVWALVKRQVFFLYLGLALTGSFTAGLMFQLWTSI
ncbi:MAG: permease [Pseudomonadota bacterium]